MGPIIFLYFAFGLIIIGLIWQATNPIIYELKNDTERWEGVTQYAPDYLILRDMLYTLYQYAPFILAFFCGIMYVVTESIMQRSA